MIIMIIRLFHAATENHTKLPFQIIKVRKKTFVSHMKKAILLQIITGYKVLSV